MKDNQQIVLRWLWENRDSTDIIKVSNGKVAEQFGWSRQYAQKILAGLVAAGYLVERRVGTGQRPTIYSFSDNQSQTLPLGRGRVASPTKRGRMFGNARIRIIDDDEVLSSPPSRRQNREGPMKKFKAKWDNVREWGPQDIVCYYRWLYHTRFGIMPEVDWKICCGTASALLKRLGSPKAVRHYLQLAFVFLKFKPQGLNSLYHSTMYETVREHWDADPDVFMDYWDDYVFPWCREILRQETNKSWEAYQKKLWDAAHTPRHLAMMEKERKQRVYARINQSMKENWDQYSEIRTLLPGIQ